MSPPALARGVASPPRFLSLPCFLFPSLGAEVRNPHPTRHREASTLGGGMGHQKACWIDLTWGVCLGLLQGAERQLCAFFFIFGGPHIFLCAVGQAAPLCYRSCDADRDEALSRSLGCVRLCTPGPVGQFAIICIMGPIVPFAGLDKVPCVCVHACTRVQRTPPGGPCAPQARVPLVVALCSGQPHLAHQGHHASKGHPLSFAVSE